MVLQYKDLVSKIKGDRVIWGVVLLLSLISLMAVYSSTGSLAYRMHYNSNHYFVKQVVVLGLGLFITFIVHNINYMRYCGMDSELAGCNHGNRSKQHHFPDYENKLT